MYAIRPTFVRQLLNLFLFASIHFDMNSKCKTLDNIEFTSYLLQYTGVLGISDLRGVESARNLNKAKNQLREDVGFFISEQTMQVYLQRL